MNKLFYNKLFILFYEKADELGKYYLKTNPELAYEYFFQGANMQSVCGYDYAYMTYYGIGCEKNEAFGIDIFSKFANFGDLRCKEFLEKLNK